MNYLITYCDYPNSHPKYQAYKQYTKPRFLKYCEKNNYKFVELSVNYAEPYNLGFAKVFWIKEMWNEFRQGDTISYLDIDCVIMNFDKPLHFDKDFSVVMENTGVLCMGGLWSLRVSDWSKRFIDEMCSKERQEQNKDLQSWNTWAENDAVYHVLGLNWGQEFNDVGTRETTPSTPDEIKEHVQFLPSEYGCTYHDSDVDWSKNKFELEDRNDPDWIYKIISTFVKNNCNFENIIIRHLSAGTMLLDWAKKYYV